MFYISNFLASRIIAGPTRFLQETGYQPNQKKEAEDKLNV
jgi:hypothetical protein